MKEDVELPEVEKLGDGADSVDINAYSYPRLDDLFKMMVLPATAFAYFMSTMILTLAFFMMTVSFS